MVHLQVHLKSSADGILRAVLRALVVLQLVVIVVAGASTVARFPVFSPIDERAHYGYLQSIAESHRLPVITDWLSPQAVAVNDGTYPGPPRTPARSRGLGGQVYEAFQPPLYYLLAAPAFAIAADYRDKVDWVRAFDFLLLLVAVALLYRLARCALPEQPLLAFSAGLTVIMFPGLIARAITISNAPLEIAMTLAVLLSAWRAYDVPNTRNLGLAGLAVGAAALTKTTLVYLAPIFLIVLIARRPRLRTAAIACLIPLVMLGPWVAFNLDHYDAVTANTAARDQQAALLNPSGEDYSLADVPRSARELAQPLLPQEWNDRDNGLVGLTETVLILGLLLSAAAMVAANPGIVRSPRFLFLALPVGLATATLLAILVGSDWDASVLARFLYPTLPGFALFAAIAWHRLIRSDGLRVAVAGAAALAVALVWAHLAGDFYFTDLGSKLPI
jgi:hypothetical protein